MDHDFIARIAFELEQAGYLNDRDLFLPGGQALLYARSAQRFRLGFAKVEDHFLFVDWENAVFGQLDRLVEIYRSFSVFVNRAFRTPHALRMQIPNLAVVAVAQSEFSAEAIHYARTTNLTPWYRGETGQIILVKPGTQEVISLAPFGDWRRPTRGVLPLNHAARVIWAVCHKAFSKSVKT